MLTVGDKFPQFKVTSVYGTADPKVAFGEVTNAHLWGRWSVFVAWPKDFTFVCPTEVLGYDALHPEFVSRNTDLYGLSTDSDHVHLAWRRSRTDLGAVKFPWLADITHELSRSLGILVDGVCLRATFIVDSSRIIRHVTVNDLNVGREPLETLRVLDALLTDQLTPCGWKKGEPTL